MDNQNQTASSAMRNGLLLFLAFIALSFILYFPVIKAEPFWDDWIFIFVKQRHIFDTVNPLIFIKTNLESRSWPVFYTFLWVMLKVFKDHYFLYHITSILLHGINCFLLYYLFKNLKFKHPLFLTLFYLVHPANLYTVSWIIQLKTLLSIFFILMSAHSLFLFHLKKTSKYLFGVIIFFTLSVFSKATTVGFVFVLIAYGFWNRKNISKKILIPFFILPTLFIALLATYQTAKFYKFDINQTATRDEEIIKKSEQQYLPNIAERIAVSYKNLNRYTSFIFYPENSKHLFQTQTEILDNRFDILNLLIFSFLYLSLIYYCYQNKLFKYLYFLFFYFGTLVPFSGLIYIPIFNSSNFVPYWLSIPLIGIIPFITLKIHNQKVLYTLIVILFTYSHSQTYLLSSPEKIFIDSIDNSPKSTTYPVALIEHYIFTGKCDKARNTYINFSTYMSTKLRNIEMKIYKCVSKEPTP